MRNRPGKKKNYIQLGTKEINRKMSMSFIGRKKGLRSQKVYYTPINFLF